MRVLVTGAASGIGRATCLRLARDGRAHGAKAQVAAVDLPSAAAGLDSLAVELAGLGAEALPLHGDMADPAAPARAVAAAVERFGGLDGLVSNAGINRPGRLVDYRVDDWDAVFAVNTRATWLLAKAAHPALKAARGAIVAVGSMSGGNAHANLGPSISSAASPASGASRAAEPAPAGGKRTLNLTRKGAAMMRKKITKGQKIAVAFSPRERMLVLDQTFAGPDLTTTLRRSRLVDGRHVARYTLGDLDELLGHIAAEANHAKDGKLRRELDALFARLQREMESHDDGLWQQAF